MFFSQKKFYIVFIIISIYLKLEINNFSECLSVDIKKMYENNIHIFIGHNKNRRIARNFFSVIKKCKLQFLILVSNYKQKCLPFYFMIVLKPVMVN